MIVTSLLSDKKYFWVKVPRTGTHSYKRLFFPELHENDDITVFHEHASFKNFSDSLCGKKPRVEHGVSVVRNPYDRFISSLKYLKMKQHESVNAKKNKIVLRVCEFCGEASHMEQNHFVAITTPTHEYNWMEQENTFYDFMYSHFDKNCEVKPGYTWEEIFHSESAGLMQIRSVLKPQMFFAYHPKVKIFHFEKMHEFNGWIEETLGIPTKNLTRDNTSGNQELNIDTTSKKFKDLVRYLYPDDLKVFGYS
jgi:hypothetical protein